MGIDPVRRRLELERGAPLRYDALLIATGSRARTLPALEGYDNVRALRTLDDALALRSALAPGVRLAVVGAGFIGLEAASSALGLGAEVTIIEALDAPLAGVLGAGLGRWFAELHRSEGATVLLGARIDRVHGGRRVRALELADGRRVACDHVLVGVGVQPDTALARGTGLDDGGVPVDPDGRTAVDDVYAAGDAALVYDPALGTPPAHRPLGGGGAPGRRGGTRDARHRSGPHAAAELLERPVRRPHPVRRPCRRSRPRSRSTAIRTPATSKLMFTRAGVPVAALLVGRPRALADARRRVQAGLDSLIPEEEQQR